MANVFHALEVGEVASTLATDAATGLSPDEARARLERVGPNRVGDYPDGLCGASCSISSGA